MKTNEHEEYVVVVSGERIYYVHRPFYREIHDSILDVMPAALPGVAYTAEMLLGPDHWKRLDAPAKQMAGRCVADMVRRGLLPLRRIGCKHNSPARYEIAR